MYVIYMPSLALNKCDYLKFLLMFQKDVTAIYFSLLQQKHYKHRPLYIKAKELETCQVTRPRTGVVLTDATDYSQG